MKVSIVIPVSDDLRITQCIHSIDERVEVVISLNKATRKIREEIKKLLRSKKLSHLKILTCEISDASIAGAYNHGIETASHRLILLMDSDCVFESGCIRRLYQNLDGNLLSKGRVVFTHNSFLSGVVARAREYHTSDKVSAFSPPLLFDKRIKKFIGNYFFHPQLCWLEDSEFDQRVQKAGLKISYDASAKVFHPPLTPRRDLRSAFWYGVGKRIGVEIGVHERPTGVFGSIRKYIIDASKKKGVLSGCYLFVWKMSLLAGYYAQAVFHLR